MMNKKKNYIPHPKQKSIRNTLQYQVFMEDICAIFGASDAQIKMIDDLMAGKKREEVCGQGGPAHEYSRKV